MAEETSSSPHLASLISSLALVPPAAVPAIIDCVLGSSAISPPLLLSSLLQSIPNASQGIQSNYVASYIAAVCHLIKNPQAPVDSWRLVLWRVFVPILKAVSQNESESINQILGLLCEAVSKMRSWELMEETLVPFCLRSVGIHLGKSQNEELAVYKWSRDDSFNQSGVREDLGTLPLSSACRILTSLLETALRSKKEIHGLGQKLVNGYCSVEFFIMNLIWDLSNITLEMLHEGQELHACASHLLVTPLFKSFNAVGSVSVTVNGSRCKLSRACFSRKIWKFCIYLFPLGHLERLDAYNILSLYFSSIDIMEMCENTSSSYSEEKFDISSDMDLWVEIRRGLVDLDACIRKHALYILKISLRHCHFVENIYDERCKSISKSSSNTKIAQTIPPNETPPWINMTKREKWADEEAKSLGVGEVCYPGGQCLSIQDRWKVFFLLYEMLEEYGTHLVEAAWTHQVALLVQSRPPDSFPDHRIHGVSQVNMETAEGIFSWLAVLWERGLSHENPQGAIVVNLFYYATYKMQVPCYTLQHGYYAISKDYSAQRVPRSFILGPFIMGLNDVVHHKDFGINGVYTSKTIKGAVTFFREYSRTLSFSDRVDLTINLASVARKELFGRAGLMALSFCISSACFESSIHAVYQLHDSAGSFPDAKHLKSAKEKHLPTIMADLLDILGSVIERSKQHFNPNYRIQVSEQILRAASSLVPICDVPLDALLHFLSTVPREFTDFDGPLRGIVREWLSQVNHQHHWMVSGDIKMQVLDSLTKFPASFIRIQQLPNALACFDDEDAFAWEAEAKRWARVLFLVITEEQHLEPITMFLHIHCSSLCEKNVKFNWVPLKLLILILALAGELEIRWRKITGYSESRAEKAFNVADVLHQQASLSNSSVCEDFARPFLLMLANLVSYARDASAIFWSIPVVKEANLPCSVRGKLGGPSQRRLASLTTSDVLRALISIRTVSCISSWSTQLKDEDHASSSIIFLLDFTWKAIQSAEYDSETGAELHLAAYETLVFAFGAMSKTLSRLVAEHIMVYNRSLCLFGEEKPLLDPLVLTFLQNINGLLIDGALTRSRRAVLMNWKWLCLDSLLWIPYNIIGNGIHQRGAYSFFSESTLRCAFLDIVESLENAGEGSVLPMLRSVRLILGLLCFGRMSPILTSSSGVTCQMMYQLVQSSWVLHSSCKKRRVAPIAALLSAVLHPSVFSFSTMHETCDNNPGPLKWFTGQLLEEGMKSPRTIRLAALHLTGLWLLYPRTLKYYIKELRLLALYGSVAFDEDFVAELTENSEARNEVLLLAQSPDREFTEISSKLPMLEQTITLLVEASLLEVFINTELYARVSVAVLFYKLVKLSSLGGEKDNEDCQAANNCGKTFLLDLLDSAVNDKDLSKELYKKYSGVHRRKVRAWQMICVLSHFVDEDIVVEVTSMLHICLCRNNLPAVRQYLETFAIQIYLRYPALAEDQLIPIFYDSKVRPQAMSSYVFIAANVIIHSELPVQMKHLNELLPPIIPFLTSHHHSLRGFTQLLVYHVLCKLLPLSDHTSSGVAVLEKKCFENLKLYLAENSDCVRLRLSMEGFLDAFDPIASATPIGIFNARVEGSGFECVSVSLMEHVITFLNDVRDDLRHSIAKDVMAIKNESLADEDAYNNSVEANDREQRISPSMLNDLSLDFQKKITLNKHVRQTTNTDAIGLFSQLLSEMEKEDQLLSSIVQSRNQAIEIIIESQQQFILVASLLDRIPNLAGLARTCEIFKAAGLAIADASIVRDKQFQLISVTAERWVPIIEVPVSSIVVFLEKKRKEGFSILGLEQTANSTPLDQFSFPRKTVLVLGREKEGIPVDIIHVLDACVEIPQLGIIRSLNVHVSGAIALWEYTRQQRSKQ